MQVVGRRPPGQRNTPDQTPGGLKERERQREKERE